MAKVQDKKLLETARDRFKKCVDADRKNRELAVDDLEFLHEPGSQWDDAIKTERGSRPCYEFNRLRVSVKRIVNEIRANKRAVKFTPNGDGATDQTAEFYLILWFALLSAGDMAFHHFTRLVIVNYYFFLANFTVI